MMILKGVKKAVAYLAILLGGYAFVLALAGFLAPCVYEALSPKIGHGFDKYVDRLRWLGVLALLPMWWTACGAKSFRELGWGLKGLSVSVLFLAGLSVFAVGLTSAIFLDGNFLAVAGSSDAGINFLSLALMVGKGLLLAFGVSLLEEIFFRGILQRIWIKGLGVGLGIWVGAFFFAWLHGRPEMNWVSAHWGFVDGFTLAGDYLFTFPSGLTVVSLINLTLLGGVLGLMYFKSRSLWVPIGFHAGTVAMLSWMGPLTSWMGVSLPKDPLIELPVTTIFLGLWAAVAWLWPNPEDETAAA